MSSLSSNCNFWKTQILQAEGFISWWPVGKDMWRFAINIV